MSLTLAATAVAAALTAVASPTASADPAWAPASTATIRPGVNVNSASGSCTSNFVFFEPVGSSFDVFIGTAAHCFTLGGATNTNGCSTSSRPVGTTATVTGATKPGKLEYSSWVSMKAAAETNSTICATNDFALVKIDPADVGRVNPSVRYFGGPMSLRTTGTSTGEQVASYGNSALRFGLSVTSPKRGISLGGSGWSHQVYTASPGIPGDSGSGFMDAQGNAFGVLVTLQGLPFPASNGVTDLSRALAYANAKTGRSIQLAMGTEPFFDRIAP